MLQPLLSHDFIATIWRMEIDEITGITVLELRNQTDKKTTFASVNPATGAVFFSNYKTEERWLTGVECVYNGVALMHFYKHETGPEHRGLIAIDATTRSTVWSNYSIAFEYLSEAGPVVYDTSFQPKKMQVIDISTGKRLRPHTLEDKPLQNSLVIPQMVDASQVIPGTLPEEPYRNIVHWLSLNNYIIVSLHTFKNQVLQQHLYVMNGATVVYHDLLHTGIQKLQPEAFVVHKNVLLYLKDRTRMIALNV